MGGAKPVFDDVAAATTQRWSRVSIVLDYQLEMSTRMTRNTVQRQIVLAALRGFDSHPTVDDIYQEIHLSHPTISKATVYRNLRWLADRGDARQVALPGDEERYDRLTSQHYHFQCRRCGTLFDVEMDYLQHIDAQVEQQSGFKVDEHEVVFRGVCPHCDREEPRHSDPLAPQATFQDEDKPKGEDHEQ